MRYQTDAIVLRRAPFSESSQIVHLLTAREGRVSVLARGVYRNKTAFGGAFDLAIRGQADASRRRSTELDLIHSFTITHPFRGVRRSWRGWLGTCYLLELTRCFAWPHDQEVEVFRLLAATLEGLDQTRVPAVLALYLASFASRLTVVAGFQPQLEACVSCGKAAPAGSAARFSVPLGGVLCRGCAAGGRETLSCSAAARSLLVRLQVGRRSAGDEAPASGHVAEARRLLDGYLEYRLERPLCTRRLLATVLG